MNKKDDYCSVIKKSEILLFVMKWMDLEDIILSEISDREKQMPYDFAYMWNVNKWTEQSRNRLINRENK